MQPIFPCALVDCIRDGRLPRADEIASLTDKLGIESVGLGNLTVRDAATLALVALAGSLSIDPAQIYV